MNYDEFFIDLANNSSRNYKIEQLNKHKEDLFLKDILSLALDPFVCFYIRKIPEYTPDKNPKLELDTALYMLSYLSNRIITGNSAIDWLKDILVHLPENHANVIKRIIKKDLNCGVSIATVNAVWQNLIPEFPVMLCSGYEQKLVDKISYPAYAQCKKDGMRFCAIVRHCELNSTVEFRTRNGKELDLLGNLHQEFIQMSNKKDVVFDGELLIKENGVIVDRKRGNGILMKAQRNTLSEKEAGMINAVIWDCIPYHAFIKGKYTVPYKDRIHAIQGCMFLEKISLVETNVIASLDEARSIFEYYLAKGEEGIILKDINGIWENKRSKTQIKFKGELECDLKIVGVQAGTGKYEGLLGSLICQSQDSMLEVNVGSGFSDEQRKELIEEQLLGKIVSVKYNSKIQNKNGGQSLFLPIFIEIRDDKEVADLFSDIK